MFLRPACEFCGKDTPRLSVWSHPSSFPLPGGQQGTWNPHWPPGGGIQTFINPHTLHWSRQGRRKGVYRASTARWALAWPWLDGEERHGWDEIPGIQGEEGGSEGHRCPPVHHLPTLSPSYEVKLKGSVISLSGCRRECWEHMVQTVCCPGYWGSKCFGMEEATCPAPLTLHPSPQLFI